MIKLDCAHIRLEQGCCWIIPLPQATPPGDSLEDHHRSTLLLTEDGKPLRRSHSRHNDIRSIGGGQYSHWGSVLYFSTSDNSDPRTNGRSYVLVPSDQVQADIAPVSHGIDVAGPVRTLFLVGCGRSGTTLLFDLLKAHGQFACTEGYPDGEDHEGWIRHGKALISGLGVGDSGVSGLNYCLHQNETDVTPSVIEAMHQYYLNTILGGNTSRVALNKNPHLSNKLRYVRAIFPNARFVHIVREPVAVAASMARMMLKEHPSLVLHVPNMDYPCLWVMPAAAGEAGIHGALARTGRFFPGDATCLGDYWQAINSGIPQQLADDPSSLWTVRYEDLCRDPLAELNRICHFAGLEPMGALPAWISVEQRERHANMLTAQEVAVVRERTCELARHYGYEG